MKKKEKHMLAVETLPSFCLIMTGPALTENAHRIIFCEHFI